MATDKEKYIHMNTRTSHKRWESMVMYALHYGLRDVELISQHNVGCYLVDGYFPGINLVIEIDEEHHSSQVEIDIEREKYIKEKLSCEFLRVDIRKPVYAQIDDIIEIVRSKNPPTWTIEKKERQQGLYSQQKTEELESAGAFAFVDELIEEFEELEIVIDRNHVGTPITPPNGEIGFNICFDGLTLSLLVTKRLLPKVLVTEYDENIVELIGINLSEWKSPKANKYKTINEFKGPQSKDEVVDFIKSIQDKIK